MMPLYFLIPLIWLLGSMLCLGIMYKHAGPPPSYGAIVGVIIVWPWLMITYLHGFVELMAWFFSDEDFGVDPDEGKD